MFGSGKHSIDVYLGSCTDNINNCVTVSDRTVTRYNYLEIANSNYNVRISCMDHGILKTNMDFRWISVPLFFHSLLIGAFSIGVPVIKLAASQTPYSMRGLIMRIAYCI